jgi:hypothetical protein
MNTHVAVKVAKAEISRVLSILELCPGFDLDEQLKLSMLEGETELNELVSSLLAENEDDEGMIAQIKAQIGVRKERIARLENRVEARRNAIISLMDSAQLTKLPLPEATISLRTLLPRPKIADADALPDKFVTQVVTLKADMKAIEEALERGETVPGVVMSNGGASLTVRRK